MSTIKTGTTLTTAYQVEGDTTGALVIQTGSTPTTAMTIDTSQNVGIGTSSPSSWGKFVSSGTSPQVVAAGSSGAGGQVSVFSDGATTLPLQIGQGYVTASDGVAYISQQANQPLVLRTNATERMRIDSSGNVGIGTSYPNFQTSGRVVVDTNGSSQSMYSLSTGGTARAYYLASSTVTELGSQANPMAFTVNGAERARIDSSGNLLVGTTSQDITGVTKVVAGGLFYPTSGSAPTNSMGTKVAFGGATSSPVAGRVFFGDNTGWQWEWGYVNSGGAYGRRFYFTDQGAAYSSTGTWGTISDARLKENVVDANPKLNEVMQLRVRNFNFITEPDLKHIGFIAQEVEEIFPSLVDESRADEDGNTTKSVKTTVLIPILVKAIQELNAKVDAQAAEIAALKGQ